MIKEFFTDPFGLKRIAKLQSELWEAEQLRVSRAQYIQDLRDEVGALRNEIADLLAYENEDSALIRAALNEEPSTRSAGSAALMLCLRYEAQLPEGMANSFKGVKSAMR